MPSSYSLGKPSPAASSDCTVDTAVSVQLHYSYTYLLLSASASAAGGSPRYVCFPYANIPLPDRIPVAFGGDFSVLQFLIGYIGRPAVSFSTKSSPRNDKKFHFLKQPSPLKR